MQINFFKNIFDKWITTTPDGRPFVDPPWENLGQTIDKPYYLKPYKAPTAYIFVFALAAAIIGFAINSKFVFPICSGILATLYFALQQSWRRSSSFRIQALSTNQNVAERESFSIQFKLKNQGQHGALDAILYFEFAASIKSKKFFSIPETTEGGSYDLSCEMVADAGMGSFELRHVYLVTSDTFGLFSRCVKHDVFLRVDVTPEYVKMPNIKLNVIGKATHAGVIEAKTPGDSTNFLGVRDFRLGDSVRRIDWKRSARHLSLIVRDFEKLNSTDATFFIDNRAISVFEFEGLNSFEHLKDSVIGLSHELIDQGVRIQVLMQDGRKLPFGSGARFLDEIIDLIRDLRPDSEGSILDFLTQNKEVVPPDSLVIPVLSAIQIDSRALREIFYGWNAIRCEVIPLIIDTPKFERQIVRDMESFAQKKIDMAFFQEIYMGTSKDEIYDNIGRKIYENTILIGPGDRVGDVYARMFP